VYPFSRMRVRRVVQYSALGLWLALALPTAGSFVYPLAWRSTTGVNYRLEGGGICSVQSDGRCCVVREIVPLWLATLGLAIPCMAVAILMHGRASKPADGCGS
jgi:hypothetical protein